MSSKKFRTLSAAAFMSCALSLFMSLAAVGALAGCSSSPTHVATAEDPAPVEQVEKQPNDAIAASAGDVTITEQEVDDYIAQYRAYIGAEENADFATLLDEAGQTPEDIREQAIDTLLAQKLLRLDAEARGISVPDEDIDTYIQDVRAGLGYASNDSGWKSVLDVTGYTDEQAYRHDIETKLLLEAVVAADNADMSASETEMIVLANSSPEAYTGAYLVEAVFPSASSTRASRFASLAKDMDIGEFREAAAAAVEDGRAEEVVDAGWTCLNENFSGAAADALTGVSAGDVAMWQEDDGSYVVAYVSEVFYPLASGRIDYASMPSDIKKALASDASALKRSNLASSYMKKLLSDVDVTVSDMPSDASYNVDMTLSSYGEKSTLSEDEISQSISEQISALESTTANDAGDGE